MKTSSLVNILKTSNFTNENFQSFYTFVANSIFNAMQNANSNIANLCDDLGISIEDRLSFLLITFKISPEYFRKNFLNDEVYQIMVDGELYYQDHKSYLTLVNSIFDKNADELEEASLFILPYWSMGHEETKILLDSVIYYFEDNYYSDEYKGIYNATSYIYLKKEVNHLAHRVNEKFINTKIDSSVDDNELHNHSNNKVSTILRFKPSFDSFVFDERESSKVICSENNESFSTISVFAMNNGFKDFTYRSFDPMFNPKCYSKDSHNFDMKKKWNNIDSKNTFYFVSLSFSITLAVEKNVKKGRPQTPEKANYLVKAFGKTIDETLSVLEEQFKTDDVLKNIKK